MSGGSADYSPSANGLEGYCYTYWNPKALAIRLSCRVDSQHSHLRRNESGFLSSRLVLKSWIQREDRVG